MSNKIRELIIGIINEQILNEGASDILYHFTYTSNVSNILETDKISLASAIGSPTDLSINIKKFFFFIFDK